MQHRQAGPGSRIRTFGRFGKIVFHASICRDHDGMMFALARHRDAFDALRRADALVLRAEHCGDHAVRTGVLLGGVGEGLWAVLRVV